MNFQLAADVAVVMVVSHVRLQLELSWSFNNNGCFWKIQLRLSILLATARGGGEEKYKKIGSQRLGTWLWQHKRSSGHTRHIGDIGVIIELLSKSVPPVVVASSDAHESSFFNSYGNGWRQIIQQQRVFFNAAWQDDPGITRLGYMRRRRSFSQKSCCCRSGWSRLNSTSIGTKKCLASD